MSDWERARLDENDSALTGHQKVSQYMQTDIFTVQPDDPVELVAELMGWERIRHVPVEDEKGRLVGLVSYRAILPLPDRVREEPHACRTGHHTAEYARVGPDAEGPRHGDCPTPRPSKRSR